MKIKGFETYGVALTRQRAFLQKFFLALFLLQLDAILLLQPTLGRFIFVGLSVFLELREESCDSADDRCLTFFRCVVRGRHPSQRWTRGEEREEIGREFVSHCDGVLMTGLDDLGLEMKLSELLLMDELA